MSERDGNFEVIIHLASGSQARLGHFPEGQARTIVREINPVSFFAQRQLVVHGAHSQTHFRPSAITYAEILMDGYPEWRWPTEITDLVQLSADRFRERYTSIEAEATRGESELGKPVSQLALIELVDGKVLYLEASTLVTSRIDQRLMSQQLATMAAIHARHAEGGALLVNLAHAVRMTFFPGSAAPANAWNAHQLPTREKAAERATEPRAGEPRPAEKAEKPAKA